MTTPICATCGGAVPSDHLLAVCDQCFASYNAASDREVAAHETLTHDALNLQAIRARREALETRPDVMGQVLALVRESLLLLNQREYKVQRARLFQVGTDDPFGVPADQLDERARNITHALCLTFDIREQRDVTLPVVVAQRRTES